MRSQWLKSTLRENYNCTGRQESVNIHIQRVSWTRDKNVLLSQLNTVDMYWDGEDVMPTFLVCVQSLQALRRSQWLNTSSIYLAAAEMAATKRDTIEGSFREGSQGSNCREGGTKDDSKMSTFKLNHLFPKTSAIVQKYILKNSF